MIRPVLAIMTVCFSLNLMANEDDGSGYTAVNGWEDQDAGDSFEDRFDSYRMFRNEEEDTDNGTDYNRFESPYEEDGYDDDSGIYEEPDGSDEQPEPDYYEEE